MLSVSLNKTFPSFLPTSDVQCVVVVYRTVKDVDVEKPVEKARRVSNHSDDVKKEGTSRN